MTDKTQALLPVTQSDREAAAACMDRDYRVQLAAKMRNGQIDKNWLIQAFARHRQSHSLPGDVGMLSSELRDAFPVGDKIGVRLSAHMFGRILAALTPQRQEYDGEAVREAVLDLPFANIAPIEWGEFDWFSFVRTLSVLAHPAQARDEMRESVLFNLTWIAPPSPELPDGRRVHPEPMTGRQSFPSWEKALRFMSKRCEGTEFVSLTQTTSRTVDRSDEFRAALSSDKGEEM